MAMARDIPGPPGFHRQSAADMEESSSKGAIRTKEADAAWKQQKAWEVAQAPLKQMAMMAFMLYMAGNSVHLFSIGILFSALMQPISALMQAPKMFEQLKEPQSPGLVDTFTPLLLYMAINVGGLMIGMWKLNGLGLLPTHPSDWLSTLPPRQVLEFSGGGVPYQ